MANKQRKSSIDWKKRKKNALAYIEKNPKANMHDLKNKSHWPAVCRFYKGRITLARKAAKVPMYPYKEEYELTEEQWQDKNTGLLNFLKKNKYSTSIDVQNAGYLSTLNKFYSGRIIDARKAAGIPENIPIDRTYPRKNILSSKGNKALILMYNCGITLDNMMLELRVSKASITEVLKEVRKKGKLLGTLDERFSYGIDFYFNNFETKSKEKRRVINALEKYVISSLKRDVQFLTIEDLIASEDPYETFLNKIFGTEDEVYDSSLLEEKLMTTLKQEPLMFRSAGTRKKIMMEIKNRYIGGIKDGRYCFIPLSDKQIREISQVLEQALSERQLKIISEVYCLHGEESKTKTDICKGYLLSRERIRQIGNSAIKKLRAPAYAEKLRKYLMSERIKMSETNAERIAGLENKLTAKNRQIRDMKLELKEPKQTSNKPDYEKSKLYVGAEKLLMNLSSHVDGMDFSVRLHNCLRMDNIRYIGDLVQKTAEELLKIEYFGRGCLQQVEKTLQDMNLQLGMRIIKQEYSVNGEIPDPSIKEILGRGVSKLGLPNELLDIIKKLELWHEPESKIEDLVQQTETSLLNIEKPVYNFETNTHYKKLLETDDVETIKDALSEHGLKLGMKVYRYIIF